MSDFRIWPDITLSAHEDVIDLIIFVCYIEDPFGDIQTPIILDAPEGVSCFIFYGPTGVWINSSASLSASHHLPDLSHLNSKRYHLVFSALNFPTVAWAAPENISNPYWASFVVSFLGSLGDGAILIIVESSTKLYPTKFSNSCEIHNLNTDMWPESWRQFKSGVITIVHIDGAYSIALVKALRRSID